MKIRHLPAMLLALSVVLPASAQDQPGPIARMTTWEIRDGAVDKFEAGLKRHNEFHVKHKDDWTIHTWEIVSGEQSGQYLRGTMGHHWADFDAESEIAEADAADSATNLDPYIAGGTTAHFAFLPDVSRVPDSPGPTPLARITTYRLKMSEVAKFEEGIRKVTDAAAKTDWDWTYAWWRLVEGGKGPAMVLVFPRDKWAGFEQPQPALSAMLAEAYGEAEAKALLHQLRSAIWSVNSYTIAYRPDLSYIPAE